MDDFETILKIQEDGIQYLDCMLKSSSKENKNGANKYQHLVLNLDEICENGKELYLDYLLNQNTELWKELCQYNPTVPNNDDSMDYGSPNSSQTILVYLTQFGSYFNKYNLDQKISLIKKLFNYSFNTDICIEFLKFPNQNGKNNFWDLYLMPILNNISIDENRWEVEVNKIQKMIKEYIKNKTILDYFVKWTADLFNRTIHKINLDYQHYDEKNNISDYILISVVGILLSFWNEGFNNSKLGLLNYNYIVSDRCPINWFDKKIKDDKEEYNFLTKCFFLILDGIRVAYIPSIYRGLKWNKELEYVEGQLNNLPQGLGIFGNTILNSLNRQKCVIEQHISIGSDILFNACLRRWIYDFYKGGIQWIILNKGIQLDDILNDMIFLFTNTNYPCTYDYYAYNEQIFDLSLDIIGEKSYTANIGIKYDFLDFFEKVLYHKLFSLSNSENIPSKLAKSLFSLFIETHNTNIRVDHKYLKKIEIIEIISALYMETSNNLKSILLETMESNSSLVKKFSNIILMDVAELNDMVDKLYKNLKTIQNTRDKTDFLKTIKSMIHVLGGIIAFIDRYINVIILSSNLTDILFSKEIFASLATVINLSLKRLNRMDSSEFDESYTIKLTKNIEGILINTFNNAKNLEILVDDHTFDLKLYEMFNESVFGEISYIIESLKGIQEKIKEEMDFDDFPQEFLDPITYLPIEDPCLLPGMVGFTEGDVYFDKSTILRQLLIKEENPYTRGHLTIQDFDDFNKTPEIITKNKMFIEKLNLFKQSKKKL